MQEGKTPYDEAPDEPQENHGKNVTISVEQQDIEMIPKNFMSKTPKF